MNDHNLNSSHCEKIRLIGHTGANLGIKKMTEAEKIAAKLNLRTDTCR